MASPRWKGRDPGAVRRGHRTRARPAREPGQQVTRRALYFRYLANCMEDLETAVRAQPRAGPVRQFGKFGDDFDKNPCSGLSIKLLGYPHVEVMDDDLHERVPQDSVNSRRRTSPISASKRSSFVAKPAQCCCDVIDHNSARTVPARILGPTTWLVNRRNTTGAELVQDVGVVIRTPSHMSDHLPDRQVGQRRFVVEVNLPEDLDGGKETGGALIEPTRNTIRFVVL